MARQLLVVALIFFAIVGMASAAAEAPAAGAEASLPAQGPSSDNGVIGNTDSGSDSDAAPVGGPVGSETFHNGPLAEAPTAASAAAFTSSGGAILAAIAGAFVF